MAADLSALVSLASLQSLLYQSVASTSLLSPSQNHLSKKSSRGQPYWSGGAEEALHGQGGFEVLLGRFQLHKGRPVLICGQLTSAETSLPCQEDEEGGGDSED